LINILYIPFLYSRTTIGINPDSCKLGECGARLDITYTSRTSALQICILLVLDVTLIKGA